MPKISVIVPVYNVKTYLKKCLESIINQTLSDIEIIIIDDGSNDGSQKIIDEYVQKDNRILSVHKKNEGYGKSCNLGIEMAKGEYIAIVEPDDFIDEHMYEDLYNCSQNGSVDIVKSSYYKFYDTKELTKVIKHSFNIKPHEKTFVITEYPELLSYHPSIWSALFRRKFLNENDIKFVEAKGSGWVDNPFCVLTYIKAKSIILTENAYYHWRNTETKAENLLKDVTIPYKRFLEALDLLNRNKIDNKDIFANIYRLEFEYINILIKKLKINNYEKIRKEIFNILLLMNSEIIENNKYITNDLKFLYKDLQNNFSEYMVKKLFNSIYQFRTEMKFYLFIHTHKGILFWGASLFLEEFLKKYKIKTKNILGIVDTNLSRAGEEVFGYKIYGPDELQKIKQKCIVLSIQNHSTERYDEIKKYISSNGIKTELLPNFFT